jgi:regulator of protease activity HflC (stomatin/prohibitin superfamily)
VSGVLEWLWQFLLDFWPVRIIDAGNQGVLYKQDGSALTLKPGLHWFWPRLWRIVEAECQYQNIDCGLQSLTTKDGKEVTISLNVGYEITDLATLFVSFQHFDATLVNLARGHAKQALIEAEWSELQADPEVVEQDILRDLRKELRACGVKIHGVTMDQLSRVKTLRLLTSATA